MKCSICGKEAKRAFVYHDGEGNFVIDLLCVDDSFPDGYKLGDAFVYEVIWNRITDKFGESQDSDISIENMNIVLSLLQDNLEA